MQHNNLSNYDSYATASTVVPKLVTKKVTKAHIVEPLL